MTKVVVFGRRSGGHRGEYNTVLDEELRTHGLDVEFTDRIVRILTARRVFFAMIDEALASFVLLAVLSLLTRQRVVGFLFRVGECFKPGPKYRLKYVVFRCLRRLPGVRVLTVMPFTVAPRFADVASGWVHDPQLWDLEIFEEIKATRGTPLSEEVRQHAAGRRLLVALGAQNKAKGFDRLADLWTTSQDLRERVLVIAAGKVAGASRDATARLRASGALVIDRLLSAEELGSLYGIADLIWGAYHPSRDLASGVIGRAFQFGIPVILRRGSFMSNLMAALNGSRIEIDFADASQAVQTILHAETVGRRDPPPTDITQEMRRHFHRVVLESLDVA